MPILFASKLVPMGEGEFKEVDYRVMGWAFSVQKELGNLFWEEGVYQGELAQRCRLAGFERVDTEVEVVVEHGDYRRSYFLDLVIGGGAVYELKAVETLAVSHRAQLLNYLLLTGLNFGKLVNFRSPSVQSEFVSTSLNHADRTAIDFDLSRWREFDDDSRSLRQIVEALLKDWGACLSIELYSEAVFHFLGGRERIIQPIAVANANRQIGTQAIPLLNPGTAFKLTAFTKNLKNDRSRLGSFLAHTKLKRLHWINFNRTNISFETISQ